MGKKLVLMLLIMMALPVEAQEKVSVMGSVLAEKKSHAVQLQLSTASQLCGGVIDCTNDSASPLRSAADACLWDKFTCHLESFSRPFETSQPWLFGGAKIKAEFGPLTFSVGRHTDNVILTRAPFIEATYQTSFRFSTSLGVLQTQASTGPQNLWYIVLRKTL